MFNIKLNCLTVENIENTRTERMTKEFFYNNNNNNHNDNNNSYLIEIEHSY